jgi:tetratricopeptide (TPR) repeat protein
MAMAMANRLSLLLLACAVSGCAAFNAGSQVQSGRQALLAHDPERALPYFLEATKTKPDYIYTSQYFREGVWTYLGRTQYATKRYEEARESLERALKVDKDDNLARLYLGLTLVRLNDPERGMKEMEAAMKGIYDWLEYLERSRPFEVYWDPARDIRKGIEQSIGSAPGKDVGREQLVADAEWLGTRMEDEVERARRDERRQYERDFDHGHGSSIGVGIGF